MTAIFVSTDWLAANLNDPNLAIVDASWYLPAMGRDAAAEYAASHIPGAVFFAIDAIADPQSPLPHMLPPPQAFAEAVGAMGISETMTILVYDELGLFSAPRVAWTFSVMGAKNVRILEGGGARWRAEGRPLEHQAVSPAPAVFVPHFDPGAVADFAAVDAASRSRSAQIVDARPADRFMGEVPEPRPGLRAGHIPNSLNLPFSQLTEDGALKSADALQTLFAEAGLDLNEPIITTCGSGITAATLALALERAGARQVSVYDGSWTEWGSRPGAAIAWLRSKTRDLAKVTAI